MIDFDILEENKKRSIFDGSAIFLPDVAPWAGWTVEETIKQLVRKAGWRGKYDLNYMRVSATR